MKKHILLFLLIITNYVCNIDAKQHQPNLPNLYDGKITTDKNGWTIIKSPLENTGAKLYLKGDDASEEIIIDIERSLNSTNHFLMKWLNIVINMIDGCSEDYYEVQYYQLITMLALASELPYEWTSNDTSFINNPWWINFVNLNTQDIQTICIHKFKEKFPKCKTLKFQLHTSKQKLFFEDSNIMDLLLDTFKKATLEIVLNNEKEE